MRALGVTAAELDIRPAARQMLADLDHPFGRGEEVYDVTFENVQAGLRTDYLFRLANHHRGDRARHRGPVGAGARLEHVRRRRPDVALQRQRRRAEDADPAPDPLGRRARTTSPSAVDEILLGDPEHRDLPRADPGQGGRGAAEHREVGRPVRAAGLQPVLHPAVRVPAVKIAFLAQHAWGDVDARRLAAGLPAGAPARLRPAGDPGVAGWCSSSGSSGSASSSARRCPTVPRCPPAAP